jgi:mRNA degradation ribonuclease J1/J2
LTAATAAFLEALYRSGWHYTTQETITRKLRELGMKNGKYGVGKRPLYIVDDGDTRKIGHGLNISAYPVNHSILEATSYQATILDSRGNKLSTVACLGDLRNGPLTEKAIKALSDSRVLIIEGTNMEENKPSIGVTEQQVKNNIEKLRQRADELNGIFIVQSPPNHLERLMSIIDVSGRRKVCVPFSMAQILHEFAILNESLPPEKRIKIPQLGKDAFIFKQPKMVYDPWEQQLENTYGAVRSNDIFADPTGFTVVLSPYRLLVSYFSNINTENTSKLKGVVVRSSYWPYSANDKNIVLSNLDYCNRQGLEYIADIDLSNNMVILPKNPIGLHASGHATKDQLLEYINAFKNIQLIVPLHTLRRGIFSSEIVKFLRQKGIQVYPEVGGVRVYSKVGKRGFSVPIPLEIM